MSSPDKSSSDAIEAQLFVSLMHIADVFAGEAEQLMKPFGLTSAQYNVLRILRGAGRPGLACREIAERMISRDPDITRLLDRMEKRGLITRARQSDDRRVVKTFVTAEGLETLKRLDQPVRELHKHQFKNIGPARLKDLAAILLQVRACSPKPAAVGAGSKKENKIKGESE
ncbi:MAG: MarR family transcriptional regulator [Acidobacteriota bacterium]|nr:MarR family transcriptional regulator [Acidobacteriota bacterium]